jgi:DNA-directed RNA polymerase specialized sigma24 family protein
MTAATPLIDAITAHVDRHGSRPPARRATRRWGALDPIFFAYTSPAEVAWAGRTGGPKLQDRLLGSLLRVGDGDWAELTALAILAPRLAWVVRGWAHHGVTPADLADLEADLVAECWSQIRQAMTDGDPDPDRAGLVLVDRARSTVRNRRTTERRRAQRHTTELAQNDQAAGRAGDPRPGLSLLAGAISEAHRAGRLGEAPARALFLTRVVGLSTDEAAQQLGTGPGAIRVLRSRAALRLSAHIGVESVDRAA